MSERYRILATDVKTGKEFECFTWTRSPEAGIRRAQTDAVKFDRECINFRAEPIEENEA